MDPEIRDLLATPPSARSTTRKSVSLSFSQALPATDTCVMCQTSSFCPIHRTHKDGVGSTASLPLSRAQLIESIDDLIARSTHTKKKVSIALPESDAERETNGARRRRNTLSASFSSSVFLAPRELFKSSAAEKERDGEREQVGERARHSFTEAFTTRDREKEREKVITPPRVSSLSFSLSLSRSTQSTTATVTTTNTDTHRETHRETHTTLSPGDLLPPRHQRVALLVDKLRDLLALALRPQTESLLSLPHTTRSSPSAARKTPSKDAALSKFPAATLTPPRPAGAVSAKLAAQTILLCYFLKQCVAERPRARLFLAVDTCGVSTVHALCAVFLKEINSHCEKELVDLFKFFVYLLTPLNAVSQDVLPTVHRECATAFVSAGLCETLIECLTRHTHNVSLLTQQLTALELLTRERDESSCFGDAQTECEGESESERERVREEEENVRRKLVWLGVCSQLLHILLTYTHPSLSIHTDGDAPALTASESERETVMRLTVLSLANIALDVTDRQFHGTHTIVGGILALLAPRGTACPHQTMPIQTPHVTQDVSPSSLPSSTPSQASTTISHPVSHSSQPVMHPVASSSSHPMTHPTSLSQPVTQSVSQPVSQRGDCVECMEDALSVWLEMLRTLSVHYEVDALSLAELALCIALLHTPQGAASQHSHTMQIAVCLSEEARTQLSLSPHPAVCAFSRNSCVVLVELLCRCCGCVDRTQSVARVRARESHALVREALEPLLHVTLCALRHERCARTLRDLSLARVLLHILCELCETSRCESADVCAVGGGALFALRAMLAEQRTARDVLLCGGCLSLARYHTHVSCVAETDSSSHMHCVEQCALVCVLLQQLSGGETHAAELTEDSLSHTEPQANLLLLLCGVFSQHTADEELLVALSRHFHTIVSLTVAECVHGKSSRCAHTKSFVCLTKLAFFALTRYAHRKTHFEADSALLTGLCELLYVLIHSLHTHCGALDALSQGLRDSICDELCELLTQRKKDPQMSVLCDRIRSLQSLLR